MGKNNSVNLSLLCLQLPSDSLDIDDLLNENVNNNTNSNIGFLVNVEDELQA